MYLCTKADLYVETIQLLERSKTKAELEVEQQRITIGNLQEALVNTKQQLEGAQSRGAAELKEKSDLIFTLYQDLSETHTQYMDCYDEIVKLSQTANCLRNSNLDLKIINTNLQQDIDELNIRLKNYQENIRILEENMRKALSTNEDLEGDVTYMRSEISNLTKELRILQGLLMGIGNGQNEEERNAELTKSLQILQSQSEQLLNQLKITQKQVTLEIQLSESSSAKIDQLQKLLGSKTDELQRLESELQRAKSHLNDSKRQTEAYKEKITALEQQVEDSNKEKKDHEKKTDEIIYKSSTDLLCLKHKVEILNKLLDEKSQEILRLHSDLGTKSDALCILTKEVDCVKENSRKETQNLLQTISSLEEQISVLRIRFADISEKYSRCRSDMEDLKKWNLSVQEEYKREKKIMLDKLEMGKSEEMKLTKNLIELKAELENTKQVVRNRDEEVKHLSSAHDEILGLKEEINRMTRQKNRLLSENEKLEDQMAKLTSNISQFENRNKLISQQLDKCLEEVHVLQCAKEKLEERNCHLEAELEHLQRTFSELNQEIRYKNDSVLNLEQELSETKCSRDEICAESRIVVGNVRSWLEDQKRVNSVLLNTVKDKNAVIEELTLEKNLLLKNIKEVCDRYVILTQELNELKHYLSEGDHPPKRLSPPLKHSVYTWGSQGSIEYESPISSPVFVETCGYEYNIAYDDSETEPGLATWMHRVQNPSGETEENRQRRRMLPAKKSKLGKESKSRTS